MSDFFDWLMIIVVTICVVALLAIVVIGIPALIKDTRERAVAERECVARGGVVVEHSQVVPMPVGKVIVPTTVTTGFTCMDPKAIR